MRNPRSLRTLLLTILVLSQLTSAQDVAMKETDKLEGNALKYWTAERIQNATPAPLLGIKGGPRPAHGESKGAAPSDVVVITTPVPCKGGAPTVSGARPVGNVLKDPYCAVGKLLFQLNGRDYVCSAAAISDQVLLTAGHCLYDPATQQYAKFVVFRAHYNTPTDDGFGVSRTAVFTQWQHGNGNHDYDIGMILTSTKMTSIGGSLGLTAMWPVFMPVSATWEAIGYPAEPPFPGNQMFSVVGHPAGIDGDNLGMTENDMTGGSSGGPWAIRDASGGFRVMGINSYYFIGHRPPVYSPRFRRGLQKLWTCVLTGVCN